MFLLYYSTIAIIFQYLYVFLHKIHKYISTNIKTSLRAVTVAVDSIRNISAGAYISPDGLFNTGTLAAYKQQLEGLTVTQQKMALMTTNLTAAQREQVLSYIASTTATKTLTAEQVLSCTADEKRILVKAGLIAEEELEKGAVINLTQEKLKEILADETLNATEKNTILTKFGVTGVNLTEASSWEVLGKSIRKTTVAMSKWLFLTPAGWATIVIAGVIGLIGAYAKWGPTLENTRKKLEDLKSECETLESDLSSVNSELETTKQRINELEGKESLTFVEAEELENLKKQNNELERTIDLLELEQRTKNKEKNKTFVDTMEKDVYSTDYYKDGLDGGKIKKGQAGSSEHRTTTTEQAYIIQQFNDREKLLDDLANAETESERKRIQGQIDKIDKYLSDRNDQFKSDAEGIDYIQNPTTEDDRKVNEWLDYINDFQDKMAVAMGGENAKGNAFNRLVDNWKFDELLNPLQKLGKEGKVTLDDLKSRMGDPVFAGFVNKLVEIGVISDTTDGSLRYLANAFNGTATSARNYITALKGNDLNNFIDNLGEEAKALGTTESELAKLTAAHVIFNNTGLDTTQQQAALSTLAGKIAQTKTEMLYLISLFNAASGNFSSGSKLLTDEEKYRRSSNAQTTLKSQYGIDLAPTKIEIPDPPKNGYSQKGDSGSGKGSNKSDKSPFDDSYYSTVEAQIADDEKKIEALEKDREALNAKFEHAMDVGNKEQAEILRAKLSENVKAQKDILAGQNILNRGAQAELLNSLYELAPTLSGKSWDEITEVELTELENSLNKASELASDDDSKNNSKLALNKFKGIVNDLQALDDAMKANSETWQKLDEDSKGYWQSQIDFQEDYSKTWIDNQKSFDKMRDDEELAAYRRMIKNNQNFQKQILNDISLSEEAKLALIKETNEKINEYEKESYELEKNIVSDILSLSKSRIESTESILQSHYDVTNSIAEAQHEINKELKASKTMYEWLDENTRKLLFNQEDYNILSNKLVNIQGEAEKLQRRYNQEVLNSTSNNLDAITSKYQMQYETLMKTYEIAKAELEVAKKRQQLDNVLNERNVRMLIDGKWRWVANTQDVINAQNELADAEYQAQQAKLERNQTDSLNNLTKAADRLTTITNQISDGEINIRDITENISSSLGGIATKSVPALKDIIQETKDALKNLVSDISGEKSSNTQSYSAKSGSLSKANASATIPGVGTVGVHINQSGKTTTKGLPVGTVVHTSGGDYKITGSDNDNYTSIKVKNAYANGTNHTKSGTALIGENGYEVFIDKDGNLIPVEQPTIFKDIEAGGKVFNAMQMRNLDALWNLSNIGFNPNNIPSMVDRVQAVSSDDNSTHYHGDIIIQNPADFNDFTQKLTKAIKMRAPITKNMPR